MRWSIAWLLYGLGCAVQILVESWLGHRYEWPYVVYNKILLASDDIQGDGPGPWKPASPSQDTPAPTDSEGA